MAVPNVFQTARSGMMASKAAIATAGHNISNAGTEGYSRQVVHTEAQVPMNKSMGNNIIGGGTNISRVERINDTYIEKQLRNTGRELAHFEEKDMSLKQLEDVFNEMNGDGLNRLMAKFFNEFRKLANDPDSEAVRESVREATQAMTADFKRIRKEVEGVREHLDNKLEGYSREVNALAKDLHEVNERIRQTESTGAPNNDLRDKRDLLLKKLGSYMDVSVHADNFGNMNVDIKGVGPLVGGGAPEQFSVERSPADDQGKPENAYDLRTTAYANGIVTHALKGGKFGALLEVRDQVLSRVLGRLDELAFNIADSVNQVHAQGFTRDGRQGVAFFKPMAIKERAAEFLDLSNEVKTNVNAIATAAISNAPGDNRVALAISGLQNMKLMNDGQATSDAWFNSMVSEVGVASSKNQSALNQQKDIMNQLEKMREQISGVSIDEETTHLLQYQHAFDASAKVIQVADEMLRTVLDLKR